MSDNRSVAEALALLVSAWPKTDLPEVTVELWAMQLRGIPREVLIHAANQIIRKSRWFPSIAEFLEECDKVTGDAPPPLEAATGYYLENRWSVHPLVEKVAKAVYWDRKVPDGRREFRDRYAAALHDHAVEVGRAALAGPERLPELTSGDAPVFRVV